MPDSLSITLTRTYHTPRYQYGDIVTDAVRGEVIVTRTSDAPIPWPMAKLPGGRKPGLVVSAGLLEALRTESSVAICHHWGVTGQTVSKWRGLLGIERNTSGAKQLWRKRMFPRLPEMHAAIDYASEERSLKISAARTGKPRPRHVIDAMTAGRAKYAWTPEEDHAIRTKSPAEAARITGRSMNAVYRRRSQLGLTNH